MYNYIPISRLVHVTAVTCRYAFNGYSCTIVAVANLVENIVRGVRLGFTRRLPSWSFGAYFQDHTPQFTRAGEA